ncbi:MAG: restriction endonuclease subunit S [Blastocatellales bacterium]
MKPNEQPAIVWTDMIPSEWSEYRIKGLFWDNSGTISIDQLAELEVDHYSIPAFDQFGFPSREDGATIASNKTLLFGGEILYSKLNCHKPRVWIVPSNDHVKVASTEFVPLSEWHRGAVNKQFISYLLGSAAFAEYMTCFQTSVTNSHRRINPSDLWQTRVPLPPLQEQERITAYLDASCAAIDEAVAAKRRQIEILDALRKSASQQILSQGLRLGLPQKDSEIESIGLVPAHWMVKQLRYACQINYGITLQLEKGQSEGDGVRILTVSNITIDGNLDLEDEYYISPSELTPDDYLRDGDLLFNWRNGSQYHVGKTAFFDQEGEFTHVSFLLRLRCGREMNPFFLRSYLGVLKDAGFFSGSKDKVNKTFNSTELKRLRVIIPPLDEQKEICIEIERRTKEINDVKAIIEQQIATLTAYRKSLIHECVTGRRRVTEADVRRVEAQGEQQHLAAMLGSSAD